MRERRCEVERDACLHLWRMNVDKMEIQYVTSIFKEHYAHTIRSFYVHFFVWLFEWSGKQMIYR